MRWQKYTVSVAVWVINFINYLNEVTIEKVNHLPTTAGGKITKLIRTNYDNKIKQWQVYVTAGVRYTR